MAGVGSPSTTGYPGVSKPNGYGRYRAHYRREYLGSYLCPLKASQAVAAARQEYRITEETLREAQASQELFT